MIAFLARRAALALPVLFGVTVISFLFFSAAPGDAVTMLIDPAARTDPAALEQQREQLGLNKPAPIRYVIWLGELAHGNLGFSLQSGRSVRDIIAERLPPTLILSGSALLIAVVIAIPLGILAAVRQYTLLDYVSSAFAVVAVSIPTFFFALALIYLLAVRVPLFPTGGMFSLFGNSGFIDRLHHLVLPATVLGLVQVAVILRYTRQSMLEVLGQDYIRTARAKGLREPVIHVRHAFRNALVPVLTIIGLHFGALFNGAVITETIFQWPGMGKLTIDAVLARDYPVLMGVVLVSSSLVLFANLVTDLLYSAANPRIRFR